MIAQLSVYPIGEGTSLGRFVKKGVAVIERSGYTYEVGGMSTTVEVPDLDALFDLVKEIHAAHVAEQVRREMLVGIVAPRLDDDLPARAPGPHPLDSQELQALARPVAHLGKILADPARKDDHIHPAQKADVGAQVLAGAVAEHLDGQLRNDLPAHR